MENWTQVKVADGICIDVYVAVPASDHGPGLLLCRESGARDPHVQALARRYAEEGYVVFAPDLAPFDPIQAEAMQAAILCALSRHPAFQGRIGVVAQGAGSRFAVAAAANAQQVACIVVSDGDLTEESLATVVLPGVLHFSSANAADRIGASRAGPKASGGVVLYQYAGTSRGFDLEGSPAFDPAAAGMAYSRTLAVLRRELGPHHDLSALWEAHRACEFELRDADATMRTMVADPYVNHVPTLTGGFGQADLHDFYRDHFIPSNPKDMRNIPISRTVGVDRVVNEGVLSFTHDTEIDWMLPGVPPTGRRVEVALVGIVTFRGDKLVHEHIYWDQASVLVQIGLLDPKGLPVAGAEAARKVLDPSLPSNLLLAAGRPAL